MAGEGGARAAPGHGQGPGRRPVLLGAAAVLVAGTAAGCAQVRPGERREPRAPTPDERAVSAAVAAAQRLRAAALAAGGTDPLAEQARRVAEDHTEHLRALGAPERVISGTAAPPAPPPASPSPGTSGTSATSGASGASGTPPSGPAALRDAEWAAAVAAARDAMGTSEPLAGLLARIAAARAAHADAIASVAGLARLGPLPVPAPPAAPAATPPSSPAPTASAAPTPGRAGLPEGAHRALDGLLAGTHAAVFAYPLVVARSSGRRRGEATGDWQEHVADRDALERLLVGAGIDPVAAAPAYEVGAPPASPADAAALAARVESGLARLAVAAVTTTDGDARRLAISALVAAARRSARWSGTTSALPGSPAP